MKTIKILNMLFPFLLFYALPCFAQKDSLNSNIAVPEDTSGTPLKLRLSGNTIWPIGQGFSAEIKYGYGAEMGFILTVIPELEVEGTFSLEKYSLSNKNYGMQYGLRALFYYLGLRVYPYRETFSIYFGGGVSADGYVESYDYKAAHVSGERETGFSSGIFKFGAGYVISETFTMDFNTSVRFVGMINNFMCNLGVIYQINP